MLKNRLILRRSASKKRKLLEAVRQVMKIAKYLVIIVHNSALMAFFMKNFHEPLIVWA